MRRQIRYRLGRYKKVPILIGSILTAVVTASACGIMMQSHQSVTRQIARSRLRWPHCNRFYHSKPTIIDQANCNLGRHENQAVQSDAIAHGPVIGLVLAEHGPKRYQVGQVGQPLVMLVMTPIANGA